MNKISAVKRRLVATLVVLFAAIVIFAITWSRIDRAARVSNATKADAVVVLGCAVKSGGVPSPALRARIEEGIRVWRATGSHYLFVTGGVGKNPPAEAVVMHQIATKAGVPDSAIIEDTTAHRTEDSADVCAATAQRLGWTRVVLVSDPWHLLRARHMFADVAPTLDIRQSPALDSQDWTNLPSRTGYMLRECVAFPVYMFRHHVL